MAGRTRSMVPIGAAPAESKARPFCRPGPRRRRRRRTRVAGVILGVVAGGGRWSGGHSGEATGQSDGRRCRVENLGHNEFPFMVLDEMQRCAGCLWLFDFRSSLFCLALSVSSLTFKAFHVVAAVPPDMKPTPMEWTPRGSSHRSSKIQRRCSTN